MIPREKDVTTAEGIRADSKKRVYSSDGDCSAPPAIDARHGHSVPYMDENLPSANPYYVPQLRKRGGSGRNDPCPCGSGKKFKHCHWRQRSR